MKLITAGKVFINYVFVIAAAWLAMNPFVIQAQENYIPRKTYTDKSLDVLKDLNHQFIAEIHKTKPPYANEINEACRTSAAGLTSYVRHKMIIDDDSMQKFIDRIVTRLVQYNTLNNIPQGTLIVKSPSVNAASAIQGTILVNIGLLSKIENESQLAFALAHEMAHYELSHIRKAISEKRIFEQNSNLYKSFGALSGNDLKLEDVNKIREAGFKARYFTRKNELEADSLGLILFKNAQYAESEAISLLTILDTEVSSETTPDYSFILHLDTEEFPLQDYWFDEHIVNVYEKGSVYMLNADSVNSHPDIEFRKQKLRTRLDNSNWPTDYQPIDFIDACVKNSKFETVESAFKHSRYDLCLYLALKLQSTQPTNSFLTTVISKVLINLYLAKDTKVFEAYVPLNVKYSDKELTSVNDFLQNISKPEIGELAYFFLKNNFDPSRPEHFYVMINICGLTDREETKTSTRQAYLKRFGKDDLSKFRGINIPVKH